MFHKPEDRSNVRIVVSDPKLKRMKVVAQEMKIEIRILTQAGSRYATQMNSVGKVPKGHTLVEIIKPHGMKDLTEFWSKVGHN